MFAVGKKKKIELSGCPLVIMLLQLLLLIIICVIHFEFV